MSWRDLEDEMSDVCSVEFAEAAILIPMIKRPNERACQDPNRETDHTRGIFEWPSLPLEFLKGRDRSATPPAAFHASRGPSISFDKRDLKWTPKQGDLVVMPDLGELTFEIQSPEPDGQGRIMCRLNQHGNATP